MANFNIKVIYHNPGVPDQQGFELKKQVETEDTLNNLQKTNVLGIYIRYIPNPQYGLVLNGFDKYYITLVGAGVLDTAQYNNDQNRCDVYRINAQIGGETRRPNSNINQFDGNRIFTGVYVSDTLWAEASRRLYEPEIQSAART